LLSLFSRLLLLVRSKIIQINHGFNFRVEKSSQLCFSIIN